MPHELDFGLPVMVLAEEQGRTAALYPNRTWWRMRPSSSSRSVEVLGPCSVRHNPWPVMESNDQVET
jgi:hypothetical protein